MAQKRYWDSAVFLALLQEEEQRVYACRGVVQAAQKGDVTILTSALTLAEVLWLRNNPRLDRDREETIRAFFEQPYIRIANVDRPTAEYAREIIWNHNVQPKDSIHLATALRHRVDVVDSFDSDFLSLDGQLGTPPLRITQPDLPHQEQLGY